jgi:hypothetical protein
MEGWGKFTMELTLNTYPFNEVLKKAEVVFVDVGGGKGHMMKKVLERWDDLNARIIVQDQLEILGDVLGSKEGQLEFQGHNFFKTQPVKGAAPITQL